MSVGHILVTGGAGYIGSHVCYTLRQRGYIPVTLDNLSHGHREAVRFGPFVEGDIADVDLITKTCATYRPVAAMHFADLIDISESVKNPDLYFRNNWHKSRLLMDALLLSGVNKLVFSSTASVYGNPVGAAPLTEDAELKPINPYGESKLKAECELGAVHGLRSVILRYFNAAGACAEAGLGEAHYPETHLIPRAILCALGLSQQPMVLNGNDYATPDGTAIRDYIHVLDLAEAHMLALDYLLQEGESFLTNLGAGTGFSIKQVLRKVEAVTGCHLPILFGARRTGDPAFLVANNSRAMEKLNWRPQRCLDDIVASAVEWHKSARYQSLMGLGIK